MTPVADEVRRHREYLLFGTSGALSAEETKKLQFWLDEEADAIVPPILKDPADSDALDRTDLLLTHYSRSRHNDWSEEWIRPTCRLLTNNCTTDSLTTWYYSVGVTMLGMTNSFKIPFDQSTCQSRESRN
jgi:hypothetical protein